MFEKTAHTLRNYTSYLICLLLTIVKAVYVSGVPIFGNANAWCDDRLMVNMACNLLGGQWLGVYNESTLVKGAMYPVYLAVLHRLGLPYLFTTTLLQGLSCALFIWAIRRLFKNRTIAGIAYLFMFFSPIWTSLDAYQRIYRCVLTPMQVLWIFAGYLGIFLRMNASKLQLLFWSLIGAVGFVSMYFTREDSIWVFPFIMVASLIILLLWLFNQYKWKELILRGIILVLPVLCLIGSIRIVKEMNYHQYGVYAVTDVNDTHFDDLIKTIYSIEDDRDIPQVSCSREKLNKLYQYSETLNSIRPIMESAMDGWSVDNGNIEEKQVVDAHFYWAIRTGVSIAGYYSDAQNADQFYEQVNKELNQAIKEGKLATRAVMPSSLMSPWRKGYGKEMIGRQVKFWPYLYSFRNTESNMLKSIDDNENGITVFERITQGTVITDSINTAKQNKCMKKVNFINNFNHIYEVCNPFLFWISIILFILLTLTVIIKKPGIDQMNFLLWITALSMALSLIVLDLGIVYTDISAYDAINPGYLSGAYPLLMGFEGILILNVVCMFKAYTSARKTADKPEM